MHRIHFSVCITHVWNEGTFVRVASSLSFFLPIFRHLNVCWIVGFVLSFVRSFVRWWCWCCCCCLCALHSFHPPISMCSSDQFKCVCCVSVSHKLEFPFRCGRPSEYWNVVSRRALSSCIYQSVCSWMRTEQHRRIASLRSLHFYSVGSKEKKLYFFYPL